MSHASAHTRSKLDMLHRNRNGRIVSLGRFAVTPLDMLQTFENPDTVVPDGWHAAALPQATVLVRALADCCHPRAARLKARLVECQGPDQLALLKAEVLNLLTLSFGPAEAQRRLQPLQ